MLVKTISNNVVDRADCIQIKDKFYQKEVDCVRIEGKWYWVKSRMIYFNERLDQYKKVTNDTTEFFTKKDGVIKIVRDELEPGESVEVSIKGFGDGVVSSRDEALKMDLVYDNRCGRYVDPTYFRERGLTANSKDVIKTGKRLYVTLPEKYNSSDLMDKFNVPQRVAKYNPISFNVQEKLGLEYSFGFEFETSGGNIPLEELYRTGLMPLRDGSISGHEYTTIPLVGDFGLSVLESQINLLNKYTIIDKECSMHIHLGGYPISEKAIMSAYLMAVNLEHEIGTLFPRYIFETHNYKAKGKDYCKQLYGASSINDIYKILSAGYYKTFGGDFTLNHPSDSGDQQKWNIEYRYYWFNLINMMFKNHGKTIEFRIHTPTHNADKIYAWLLITSAILKYAEENIPEVLDRDRAYDLSYIIKKSEYPLELQTILLEYINWRESFCKEMDRVGDYAGISEILNDSQEFGLLKYLKSL